MTEPTALSLSVEDGIAVLTFDLPGNRSTSSRRR